MDTLTIPQSQLSDQSIYAYTREVSKEHLNYDVMHIINSYINTNLSADDSNYETFWLKLGIETCNLQDLLWCCIEILQSANFTKSSKELRYLLRLHEQTTDIRYLLNEIIIKHYPTHNTITHNDEQMDILNVFNGELSEINRHYCFYGSSFKFKILEQYKRMNLKKKLMINHKGFIDTILNRMHSYVDYLESNFQKFPSYRVYSPIHKKAYKKNINNLKKHMEKDSIIRNIEVNIVL